MADRTYGRSRSATALTRGATSGPLGVVSADRRGVERHPVTRKRYPMVTKNWRPVVMKFLGPTGVSEP